MIEFLPTAVSLLFIITTALTLGLFYWTIKNSTSKKVQKATMIITAGMICWLVIQARITFSGIYYSTPNDFPPKLFLLGILPLLVTIFVLFVTKNGRRFIDALPLKQLTYLHIVRIPVEIVLFWLSLEKAVPQLMTFEGRNFDILAGITAPIVAYLIFSRQKLSTRFLLIWNFCALALLLNIVINALLSAPFPIQKFAFEQPNIAILYFPFSWLPTFIVPVVLFSHLAAIRQLTTK